MIINSGGTGTNNALASSWNNWGCADSTVHVADIVIWPDGHHVGIVTSIVGGVINMTSGNNGPCNQGCIETYSITSDGYTYRSAY